MAEKTIINYYLFQGRNNGLPNGLYQQLCCADRISLLSLPNSHVSTFCFLSGLVKVAPLLVSVYRITCAVHLARFTPISGTLSTSKPTQHLFFYQNGQTIGQAVTICNLFADV